MDKLVVTELIQDDFNTKRLKIELEAILTSDKRKQMLKQFDELEDRLGGIGASEKTAKLIVENIKNQ